MSTSSLAPTSMTSRKAVKLTANGSTKKAGTGNVNGLQIDASNVSSVQAGKINIVGTESGVGVR